MATVGPDGIVRMWDPATGKGLHQFKVEPAGKTVSSALSADGKTLFIQTTDGIIRQWDVPAGKLVRQLDQPVAPKRHLIHGELVLLGDGQILAAKRMENDKPNQIDASGDPSVSYFDVATGKALDQPGAEPHGHEGGRLHLLLARLLGRRQRPGSDHL